MKDLHQMQCRLEVPMNIHAIYMEELRHAYVVHPEMIEPVIQFCVQCIRHGGDAASDKIVYTPLKSRL